MSCALDRLSTQQRGLLEQWFPGFDITADLSWNLVETTVLHLTVDDGDFVVKAGGVTDHHIAREIRAHERWTRVWVETGHAAPLIRSDATAKLIATQYLPGRLVQDDPAAGDLDTYEQAGRLLATFHGQESIEDPGYEQRADEKALRWLERPHRIAPELAARVRGTIESWPRPPSMLVPTHGDWQGRNWIVDDDRVVRVIDFGRADLRPAAEDFERMATREFVRCPGSEAAFLRGYGTDPANLGRGSDSRCVPLSASWCGRSRSETNSSRLTVMRRSPHCSPDPYGGATDSSASPSSINGPTWSHNGRRDRRCAGHCHAAAPIHLSA